VRRLPVLAATFVAAATTAGPAAAMAQHQVAGLQVALYRFGLYKGEIDGIPGPMTKRAIVDLQRAAKLEPDGVPGKRTRAALGRFGRPLFGVRTLRRGMIGFDVSVLQYLLSKRGFPPTRLNSNFGPRTEELVRKFQRKAGLVPDGIVGKQTRAALLNRNAKTKPRAKVERHVVRPGESLTAIAERHGTTVRELAIRNRLDPQSVLLIGTRLVVPRGSARPAAHGSVTASLDRWAAHYGVDPKLARALAWQESGFQQRVRSSVGAVGVMQVTPATWSFVELFVIGRNVPPTMDGNVRVGVAYLAHLLKEFRGETRLAVAAYYQGPAGVRRNGLYDETKRFVANVLALRSRF
jgi:peptidoglycan hydrolase-like protein with peptidoglycan-binding domain